MSKIIRWNGKKYNSIKELSDEAGFNEKQYRNFRAALNKYNDVDRALQSVYLGHNRSEVDERDKQDKLFDGALDNFSQICKKFGIKNTKSFRRKLESFGNLDKALDAYYEEFPLAKPKNKGNKNKQASKAITSGTETYAVPRTAFESIVAKLNVTYKVMLSEDVLRLAQFEGYSVCELNRVTDYTILEILRKGLSNKAYNHLLSLLASYSISSKNIGEDLGLCFTRLINNRYMHWYPINRLIFDGEKALYVLYMLYTELERKRLNI